MPSGEPTNASGLPEGSPPPAVTPAELGIGQLFWEIPDAIVVADAATNRIALWNPAAERLFGYSAAEAVGRPVDLIVPARHQESHAAGMRRFHTTGHGRLVDGHLPLELPAANKAGEEIAIELTLTRVTPAPNGRNYVLAIVRDITERRRAEAAQAHTLALEATITERTNELKRAYEALVEADRYKDEFLSVISHELRTPLNFIMGFASLLEDQVPGALNDFQRAYVSKILNGADRMLHLVNDLLDFAKIQAGKFDMDLHPTDYAPIVQEVVATMMPLAEDRGIRLAYETDVPGMPCIDGPRVIQVLTNLLSNAIKFTSAGGLVTVKASLVTRDGEQVLRTEVTDTGVGIPEAQLSQVFEKFKQLDMTMTRQAGGTGLGLAICKALVEGHGGRIGVTSRAGQGSTFWFELPFGQDVS